MDVLARCRRPAAFAALVLLGLSLSACTKSTVTAQNYEKINPGMSLKEVQDVLGPGEKEEGGDGSGVAAQFGVAVDGGGKGGPGETYVWQSGGKTIRVHFAGGKVTNKQKEGF